MIVARETAKRYGQEGIISISLNPGRFPRSYPSESFLMKSTGNIQSDLQRHLPSVVQKVAVSCSLQFCRGTTLRLYILEPVNLVPNAIRRAHTAVGRHDARSSELQRRSTSNPEYLLVPSNDFPPVPDSLGSPREMQTGGV